MTRQVEFIWHPLRNNPLDFIAKPLIDAQGRSLVIRQLMDGDFIIDRGGERVLRGGNIAVCYYLNQNEAAPATKHGG